MPPSTPTDTEPPSPLRVNQLKTEEPPTRKPLTLALGNTAPLATSSTPTPIPGAIPCTSTSATPASTAAKIPPSAYVPPSQCMIAGSPAVNAPLADPATPKPNYDFARGRPVIDAGNPFNLPAGIARKAKSSVPIVDENIALGLDSAKELTARMGAMMEKQVRECSQQVQREAAKKKALEKRIEELEEKLGERETAIGESVKRVEVAERRAKTPEGLEQFEGESDNEVMKNLDCKSDSEGIEESDGGSDGEGM